MDLDGTRRRVIPTARSSHPPPQPPPGLRSRTGAGVPRDGGGEGGRMIVRVSPARPAAPEPEGASRKERATAGDPERIRIASWPRVACSAARSADRASMVSGARSLPPDGQWLVFERAILDSGGNFGSGVWHIFKVRLDGTGLLDLSLAGGHDDRAEYLPAFSPVGTRIVFGSKYEASPPSNSHNDVFTMDINGGNLVRLTTDPVGAMLPVWLPQ